MAQERVSKSKQASKRIASREKRAGWLPSSIKSVDLSGGMVGLLRPNEPANRRELESLEEMESGEWSKSEGEGLIGRRAGLVSGQALGDRECRCSRWSVGLNSRRGH
jgi:hypothetical protein